MDLSVIIVSYRSAKDIGVCIASVKERFRDVEYEIIVVNNYAGDEELALLAAEHPDIIVLDDGENKGFGRGNNAGAAVARGRYLCYMNPDIIVLGDIAPLLAWMRENPDIGMAGPLLRNQDMTLQESCRELPTPDNWFAFVFSLNSLFPKVKAWGNYSMKGFPYKGDADAGWVSGAYLVAPRQLMQEIGGFDPAFFMYCEDTDLCWKVRDAGYRVVFSDRCEAIHIGGTTSASKSEFKARALTESYEILWRKRYGEADVRRMMRQTYRSAQWKAFCYGVLCALRLSGRKTEAPYNRIVASILRDKLRGA